MYILEKCCFADSVGRLVTKDILCIIDECTVVNLILNPRDATQICKHVKSRERVIGCYTHFLQGYTIFGRTIGLHTKVFFFLTLLPTNRGSPTSLKQQV